MKSLDAWWALLKTETKNMIRRENAKQQNSTNNIHAYTLESVQVLVATPCIVVVGVDLSLIFYLKHMDSLWDFFEEAVCFVS